eukprot:CAMPEP_0118674686 /NCGR_PEP_ID=MMETSP0800-20121206/1024_1 /TAXON_ID=210618 ORGANISM="Striatella unipunctata, Strain CCMP2910" /NCGR_SAMPLE_ID=MMETSP0800 /ASSEMBLY_ACC=CAM_ASM_000638 /LENGTH=323 /DNA_ID=CAMNT_0006569905 /DNA_START=390 /DNA_END=1362 /DNA_ORIENTATION=-
MARLEKSMPADSHFFLIQMTTLSIQRPTPNASRAAARATPCYSVESSQSDELPRMKDDDEEDFDDHPPISFTTHTSGGLSASSRRRRSSITIEGLDDEGGVDVQPSSRRRRSSISISDLVDYERKSSDARRPSGQQRRSSFNLGDLNRMAGPGYLSSRRRRSSVTIGDLNRNEWNDEDATPSAGHQRRSNIAFGHLGNSGGIVSSSLRRKRPSITIGDFDEDVSNFLNTELGRLDFEGKRSQTISFQLPEDELDDGNGPVWEHIGKTSGSLEENPSSSNPNIVALDSFSLKDENIGENDEVGISSERDLEASPVDLDQQERTL